jgi:hypothetical protein
VRYWQCRTQQNSFLDKKPGTAIYWWALSRRFLSPARPYLLTKTENNYNYPLTLAYQNREQLPVYTGSPKPRTITRLHWLTKTENYCPFTLANQNREQLPVCTGICSRFSSVLLVIKTGNNYRPCGVWSPTLPVQTANCRQLLEQCNCTDKNG